MTDLLNIREVKDPQGETLSDLFIGYLYNDALEKQLRIVLFNNDNARDYPKPEPKNVLKAMLQAIHEYERHTLSLTPCEYEAFTEKRCYSKIRYALVDNGNHFDSVRLEHTRNLDRNALTEQESIKGIYTVNVMDAYSKEQLIKIQEQNNQHE